MEDASYHPSSLAALVCAPLASHCPSYIKNPIVLSFLKIWKQFRQHFKLSTPIPLSPTCNNHFFPPSNTDTAFTLWRERGLVQFSDLYSEGLFVTFNDLRVKYNLPQSHMFRYLHGIMLAHTLNLSLKLQQDLLSLRYSLRLVVRFQYYLTSYHLRICPHLGGSGIVGKGSLALS